MHLQLGLDLVELGSVTWKMLAHVGTGYGWHQELIEDCKRPATHSNTMVLGILWYLKPILPKSPHWMP